jgi:hypothetical protein
MRSPCFSLAILAVSTSLAAACGTAADVHQTAGSTGSGGASSGATSSATSSATAGSTSTGTGGAPATCGGKAGIPCGPTEFCRYDPSGSCGNADGTGTCQPRPQGCDADCPGVCGCDGKFYCNACNANAAGVDVGTGMECLDAYEAASLFTNLPRFDILKASPLRNLCFRATVLANSAPGIGISSSSANVESALVTNDASDCKVSAAPPPTPKGAIYPAASGMGTVTMTMGSTGCVAAIHAKLVFSGAPPWAPPTESIYADGLAILGGCP